MGEYHYKCLLTEQRNNFEDIRIDEVPISSRRRTNQNWIEEFIWKAREKLKNRKASGRIKEEIIKCGTMKLIRMIIQLLTYNICFLTNVLSSNRYQRSGILVTCHPCTRKEICKIVKIIEESLLHTLSRLCGRLLRDITEEFKWIRRTKRQEDRVLTYLSKKKSTNGSEWFHRYRRIKTRMVYISNTILSV